MRKTRPALFRHRHFEEHVIVLCVRWYLRYCLTLRDLEELMAERGLGVDHSTIGRWVLRYAPELPKRIRRDIRTPNCSWRVDETYVPTLLDAGPIYIGRSIPAVRPLISCSLLRGMRWLPSIFYRWRCGEWRAESSLPVPTIGVFEQCAGARSPIP